MGMPGVPAEGLRTISQITPTNGLRFRYDQDVAGIGIELLRERLSGAPVVAERDRIVGWISEIDILRSAKSGCDLKQLRAQDIMTRLPLSIDESTSIADAIDIMDACHLHNLPVQRNGEVTYSITRHDLLRATIGLGPAIEDFEHG